MKKQRITLCILLIALLAIISGCGTPFEPVTYLSGNLDLIYHNTVNPEFAESLSKKAVTQAETTRQNHIETTAEEIFAEYQRENPPEDLREKLETTVNSLYNAAKYTVLTAEETETGYAVAVTAYPLLTYQTLLKDSDGTLAAAILEQYTAGMSAAEISDTALTVFCDTLTSALKEPTYGEPVEITLQISKDEEGYYTVNSDDFLRLEQILLYNNAE